METQLVFLSHGNFAAATLKEDGSAVDLSGVTRMTLTLGTKLIDSDNGDADPIRWAKAGYGTGEVRFYCGEEVLTAGKYQGWLILYDLAYSTGFVWPVRLPVYVRAEVEASA